MDFTDTVQVSQYLLAHPDRMDLDSVDDALLLVGTAEWSWDAPVSTETIDAMPDQIVRRVLERLRNLFAEPGEPEQKKGG